MTSQLEETAIAYDEARTAEMEARTLESNARVVEIQARAIANLVGYNPPIFDPASVVEAVTSNDFTKLTKPKTIEEWEPV